MIEGMSKDQPLTVNELGGGQSKIPYRFDLIDSKAMFEMAKVLSEGAEKYGAENWRLIPVEDHINHAVSHLYAYLAGDTQDDHLSHALCRAMFAMAVSKQNMATDPKVAKVLAEKKLKEDSKVSKKQELKMDEIEAWFIKKIVNDSMRLTGNLK